MTATKGTAAAAGEWLETLCRSYANYADPARLIIQLP